VLYDSVEPKGLIKTGLGVTGMLIAIPWTTRIGVLFYNPFAVHIAAISWCFSLPVAVKVLSTFIAIGSFCLIIEERSIYKKFML